LLLFTSCNKNDLFKHNSNQSIQENIQRLADAYVGEGLPGMVLMVDEPNLGKHIISSGMADKDNNIPITKDHLFHSASVMKTYTATCIFMLQEQGKLNIQDKIADHLPTSIIQKTPNGDLATIEQLMKHCSGIPDFAEQEDYLNDLIDYSNGQNPPQNFLEYIKDKKANFIPGNKSQYCNTGYYLLSLIVAEKSNQSFESFLNDNIIQKLSLQNTFYRNLPLAVDYTRVPQYYIDWDSDGNLSNSTDLENKSTQTFEGFSGLLATIEDYHRFLQSLMVDKSLISQASLNQMMSSSSNKGFGYGNGLEIILSNRLPSKYGHKGGTQASFFYYPSKNTLVLSMLNYSFLDGESPFDQMAIARDKICVNGNLIGEIEKCLFE